MFKRKNKFWVNCVLTSKSSVHLSFIIFLLFAFLFLFNQSVSSTDKSFKNDSYSKINSIYSSAKSHLGNYGSNLPKDNTPKSNEEKTSDENELTEDTDDISGFWGCIFVFYDSKIPTGINFYLYQLQQILQNRCSVALFVLHHSWKSFLI